MQRSHLYLENLEPGKLYFSLKLTAKTVHPEPTLRAQSIEAIDKHENFMFIKIAESTWDQTFGVEMYDHDRIKVFGWAFIGIREVFGWAHFYNDFFEEAQADI